MVITQIFNQQDLGFMHRKHGAQEKQVEVKNHDVRPDFIKHALSQTVRNFGERMVTDHTKVNDELKKLAEKKKATLPTRLSKADSADMSYLEKLSSKDFDRAYAEDMVKDHEKDLKAFQTAAKDVSDPDLKAFVKKTIPTLEAHLRMAKDMQSAVKSEK